MNSPVLRLENVRKAYSGKLAVDNASFEIPKGSIFGLLGPNGAGKTSIIRMITLITAPDSGRVVFNGREIAPGDTASIGYMPEERGLYKKMKVREHLIYLLQLKDKSGQEARRLTDYWLQKLDIASWANKKITDLSKGMQQKVQFIATVAHAPELLILDEPFSGLDPINSQLIEDEIRSLREAGATIIFSTHRMEQVEELCDDIVLINQGRVVLADSMKSIRVKFRKPLFELGYEGDGSELARLQTASAEQQDEHHATLRVREGHTSRDVMRELAGLTNLTVVRFEQHVPKLQNIFIETVKGSESHA